MNRQEFAFLAARRPIILDGSTGTELVKRGLPPGAAPEKWVLEHPEAIRDIHRGYAAAGSDIVLACTFGANRIKLADHGLGHAVREMNVELARISRPVLGDTLLFGDLSPTGSLVEPFGELPFEEAFDVYRQQAAALLEGGVDGFLIETMIDIQEARAALLAVRSVAPEHPVLVSMTYDGDGKTLTGASPAAAVVTLQALGADAVGSNCSTGPEEMLPLVEACLPYARVPILAKPNAGLPCMENGCVHYDLDPEPFAAALARAVNLGVRIVGGCCGTTADHIKAAAARIKRSPSPTPSDPAKASPAVSSARRLVSFSSASDPIPPLRLIGERINPTGKKAFQAELLSGDFSRIRRFADEQAAAGADLLDVNLGLGGLDEPSALRQAVAMLAAAVAPPLCIDTVNPDAMEAALRLYPGRALVNSVSGEKIRLEKTLPLAARYGAMLIVLPVGEGFMPVTPDDRLAVTGEIMTEAAKYGYTNGDVLVDGLAMTVSADPQAARNSLVFLARLGNEMGLRSVIGLSNVSFGMPERELLNATFLAMAMANGLEAVIANPSAATIMAAKSSGDVLYARRGAVGAFIDAYSAKDKPAAPALAEVPADSAAAAGQAVLKGEIKRAAAAAREALDKGMRAEELVSKHLVPSIMKAGELFEKKEYYLPQLMLAGEAMRRALDIAEPALRKELSDIDAEKKGVAVFATVKGDVHDIGKNLVVLMLRNHGFEVHDLGKDVSAEAVVAAVREHQAQLVGLSALMTTTLAAMRDTVSILREAGVDARIMVGGAAVTEGYAQEIGADGYSPDAVSAVKLAESLMAARGRNSKRFVSLAR